MFYFVLQFLKFKTRYNFLSFLWGRGVELFPFIRICSSTLCNQNIDCVKPCELNAAEEDVQLCHVMEPHGLNVSILQSGHKHCNYISYDLWKSHQRSVESPEPHDTSSGVIMVEIMWSDKRSVLNIQGLIPFFRYSINVQLMPNSKASSEFSNHCWKHKCFTAAITLQHYSTPPPHTNCNFQLQRLYRLWLHGLQ